MIVYELYMSVALLFLAGKDATSFRLKDKNAEDKPLEEKRINRWHRDGAILAALFLFYPIYKDPENWWKYLGLGLLLRLVLYDPAFNKWAGLDYKYLGSTAWWDRQFIKIFGKYGAIKKSLFFLTLLIIVNFLL